MMHHTLHSIGQQNSIVKYTSRNNFNEPVLPKEDFNRSMLFAVSSAIEGITKRLGGPFGCTITRNSQIVATSYCTVFDSNDDTRHAEINCIRLACTLLNTSDLSDCDIYVTCEPCPMCWGACYRAKIRRIFIGVDKSVAEEYGFNNGHLHDELCVETKDVSPYIHKNILTREDIREILLATPLMQGRLPFNGSPVLSRSSRDSYSELESPFTATSTNADSSIATVSTNSPSFQQSPEPPTDEKKKKEIPSAFVVKKNKVIAIAGNTVFCDKDPTATAVMNVLRKAAKATKTSDLSNCILYTITEPDIMSLGAIYCTNIAKVQIGLSEKELMKFSICKSILGNLEPRVEVDYVISIKRNIAFEQCKNLFKIWKGMSSNIINKAR